MGQRIQFFSTWMGLHTEGDCRDNHRWLVHP